MAERFDMVVLGAGPADAYRYATYDGPQRVSDRSTGTEPS